jgi:hypothetical protein
MRTRWVISSTNGYEQQIGPQQAVFDAGLAARIKALIQSFLRRNYA